ncbi:hypothetical protein ACJ41O_002916 [Fusarium nematophilum]
MTKAERREWIQQYYQGVSVLELAGFGCGSSTFSGPKFDFVSPFQDKGKIEIMSGTKGPGSGGIRIIRGNPSDPRQSNIFMVPFRHIEQAIIISHIGEAGVPQADGIFRVILVPTGATGATGAVRKYPQIIHFTWPHFAADETRRGKGGRESDKDVKMYLAALKTSLSQQLVALDKQVIVYSDEEQTAGQLPMFKYPARLEPLRDSFVESGEGSLLFLSTGILWHGESILYFPFSSLKDMVLVFARDLASKTREEEHPIVAMGMVVRATEPFYEANGSPSESRMLSFKDIQDHPLAKHTIHNYCVVHKIKLAKVQQIFYNYKENSPMSGWDPMMED